MAEDTPQHDASTPRPHGLDMRPIRAAVLRRMLWAIAVFGGLVLLNIEVRLFLESRYGLGLFYLFAYGATLSVAFLSAIPHLIRAATPLLVLLAVGTLEFWFYRLHSMGLLYYFVAVVIAGGLFGKHTAYGVVALCASAIGLFGILFAQWPFPIPPPDPSSTDVGMTWRGAVLNFTMLAILATSLHEQLIASLQESTRASQAYFAQFKKEASDRLEAERELREREVRLRGIVEASRDWIWAIDLNGRHTYCNPAVKRILGYEVEELVSASAFDFIHDEDRKQVEAFLPAAIAEKRGWEKLLVRWRHKDGHYRYLESNAVPVLDEAGTLVGFQGVDRDVTERKQTEEALRRSETRNTAILEVLPDIMFCLDRNGVHLDFHVPPGETILAPVDQLIGHTVHDLLPQAVAEEYMRRIARTIDRGSVEVFEYELHYAETDLRVFEARMVPQDVDIVLTIVRNITERRAAERRLARYRDQLEELVRERTQALEEALEELVRKERLAALGTLTATVAHEIRNPLGTVRNAVFSIGNAAAKGDLERVSRALKLAENNIVRCDGIINELLDFTGKRRHALAPMEIDPWLAGVLEDQVLPDRFQLELDLGAGQTLNVDAEHVRRAVVCVFNNAIQAMQAEGARGSRLTVTTAVTGERLEMRFADQGPGIPAEIRGQIFEPLFSTKSFGVGLGVPIARDIMVEHGGGLEYHDGKDGGTVAVLWIPLGG